MKRVTAASMSAVVLGWSLSVASPAFTLPGVSDDKPLDIPSLVLSRDPTAMYFGLDEGIRKKIEEKYSALVLSDSEQSQSFKNSDFYPNPMIQAYVNRLGQTFVLPEVSDRINLSFRIIEDPLPYASALSTGTIYLSSGLLSLLENESQLAFILAHEAGHVVLSHHLHQVIEDEKDERRTKRLAAVGAVAGVVLGAITKGKNEAVSGVIGAVAGYGIGKLAELSGARFSRVSEIESDQYALAALISHGFDARESANVLSKILHVVRRSGSATEFAIGGTQNIAERSGSLQALLRSAHKAEISRVLSGPGFRMSSPRFSQLISEIKRDNGLLALDRDLFSIARANLEEAAAVRTDDPLTMYGLGMLYRSIGRTAEDQAKASSFLRSAMEFDEVRHRFPEAYLQYAVELLSREDPKLYPEIQSALKTYVALYQRKTGGALPREMNFLYDYLDLTGDRVWVAYAVTNINAQPPYQLIEGETMQLSPANPKASK